jgi:monothiol glutaredoxin
MTDITTRPSADDVATEIAQTIAAHPAVLFMKGTPSMPQCGFSALVVAVLRHHGVAVHAVDVLADPAVRQGIKEYSNWPTIPQLYVAGEFIGGADIVREMHESGELKELFERSNLRHDPKAIS